MATYKDIKKLKIGSDTYELGIPNNDNQTVTVGNVTFDANAPVELVGGSNVTLTANSTNNKITIAATDTVYAHPSYTAAEKKLYKVAVDELGHVASVTEVIKSDITALGIPAQDTVYTHPSSHAATMITGLAKVATTGSYSDLSDKPTINNGVLTIKRNNTSVGTFSANQSSSATINIEVPVTSVSFTQSLTSGTKVGSITINGTETNLYAPTDTKNTAGSTSTNSKIYLVGATSQASSATTYSHDTVYVETDGYLYSGGSKVLTSETTLSTGSATATSTLSHSGTFTAITGISVSGHKITPTTTTYTLPSDNNTDTKVTQTATTSNASYPLLLAPAGQTTTATTTSYFDSGVTLNPHTNTIAANISGKAATADALTTNAGSATKPVYFSGGVPVAGTYTLAAACAKGVTDSTSASAISTGTNLVTERDVYYGLPKINNNKNYTSSTTIYAPTAGGTSGYVLVGNGTTSAPTWRQSLPIANGGTGATTVAGALANLGFSFDEDTGTLTISTS